MHSRREYGSFSLTRWCWPIKSASYDAEEFSRFLVNHFDSLDPLDSQEAPITMEWLLMETTHTHIVTRQRNANMRSIFGMCGSRKLARWSLQGE